MRTRDLKTTARRMGREAGKNAASWAWDGNTSTETARRVIRMMEDGDPALYDVIRGPDLSGEHSGDPTPRSLADDCGLPEDDSRAEWLVDELCSEWEKGVSSTFWPEVERAYRAMLA